MKNAILLKAYLAYPSCKTWMYFFFFAASQNGQAVRCISAMAEDAAAILGGFYTHFNT